MKALVLGNMVNNGYNLVKELRSLNVDVELGLNNNDFGMSYPEWEEGTTKLNPYELKREQIIEKEQEWIRNFELPMNLSWRHIPKRLLQVNKIKKTKTTL